MRHAAVPFFLVLASTWIGLEGGCSTTIETADATGGDSTSTSSSASGSSSSEGGELCGDWDPENGETPAPKCAPVGASKSCEEWANATVPPRWPALTAECGDIHGLRACLAEDFVDPGPSCEEGAAGDAACGQRLQGFVKGEGTAISDCVEWIHQDDTSTFVCKFNPYCPYPHICAVNQVCVKRPGKEEACEIPCSIP